MLSKIDSKDADAKEFMEVANKLKGMKIFTTENSTAAAQMKTEALAYVKNRCIIRIDARERQSSKREILHQRRKRRKQCSRTPKC